MRSLAVATALVVALSNLVSAQVTWTSGWVVSAGAQVDLWYHGMATIGLPTISALPMYDRDHVRRVTAAKRAAGIHPTALDQEADDLRDEFQQYPAFELLHFVPAYFPHATPERMLDALRRAADGEDAGGARADVAFGIDVVGRTLRSSRERNALRRFVDLLESEWSTFYAAYWRTHQTAATAAASRAKVIVDELLRTALATDLSEWRLQSGAIFVSGPVGPHGRVFVGDPQNPVDNVVIVRLPPEDRNAAERAALSVPRELCLPLVRATVEALRIGQMDRYEAEQAAGRGAVRCGAYLIDRHLPHYSQTYRDNFVETARGLSADEFADVFAIPTRLDERIRSFAGRR